MSGGLLAVPSIATTASSASSLFPPAQSAAPSGGSLLGGLGRATAQPASSSTGGSLFGRVEPASSAPPAASGAQAPATSGLFSSTLVGSPRAQPAQDASLPNAAKPPNSAHFEHLLERGRKRHSEQNGTSQTQFADLPSLQLGLGDIARKVRNLGAGGPSASPARNGKGDTKAQVDCLVRSHLHSLIV
ncbi:MAG: hypothetical protein INR71_08735 [Terriglobus roseus]|nr:hypothetical protein [Terriglobus roseus]